MHWIVKTYFVLEIAENESSDVVDLRICDRFQFFYRKSANVCGKKSVRKSANQNLKSAICGLADRFCGSAQHWHLRGITQNKCIWKCLSSSKLVRSTFHFFFVVWIGLLPVKSYILMPYTAKSNRRISNSRARSGWTWNNFVISLT